MPTSLFTQNVIAIIWDFDKTLTPAYMQAPLFKRYGVDEKTFWDETNGLADFYKARGMQRVSKDSLYLNHILTYVNSGAFRGLNNKTLYELGAEIEFYSGMPEFLQKVKDSVASNPVFVKHGVTVENYVVSTGLSQMIMGSKIAGYVDGIWGCEFIEENAGQGYLAVKQPQLFDRPDRVISGIGYVIDNTSKTRALFEINKGTNKHPEIDVNAVLAPEDRRVPFQNMIYIADGPSDVPAFSIVNQYGGRTLGVYKAHKFDQFQQVDRLQKEDRVQGIGEANYVDGSLTQFWITNAVTEIATRIVADRESALRERVGLAPHHILTDISGQPRPVKSETSVPKKPLDLTVVVNEAK
jgi:hypothetical protein